MDDIIEMAAEQVRDAWVKWAASQPNPKPSWLVPWSELDETSKAAYRAIARALVGHLCKPSFSVWEGSTYVTSTAK